MNRELMLRYTDNMPRHILSVNLFAETRIMQQLISVHGHAGLRISFEPYVAMARQRPLRLTDVAEALQISRQAAKQTADRLIELGYLQSQPSAVDGRAKLLTLTARGEQLAEQGAVEGQQLLQVMSDAVGSTAFAAAERLSAELNLKLQLPNPVLADLAAQQSASVKAELPTVPLIVTLPRLADYVTDQLQQLTMQKGHPGLKRSYGMVLQNISVDGGRISKIAAQYDVSKQSVSAIAAELVSLGYISRETAAADVRQLRLHFTAAGQRLIEDSIEAVRELEQHFAKLVGAKQLAAFKETMRALHQGFCDNSGAELEQLAQQLYAELGEERARQLANLLLQPKRGVVDKAKEHA